MSMIRQMETLGLDPYDGLSIEGNLRTREADTLQHFLMRVASRDSDLEPLPVNLRGRLQLIDDTVISRGLLNVSLVLPPELDKFTEYSHEIEFPNSGPDEEFYAGIKIQEGRILGGRVLKAYNSLLEGDLTGSVFYLERFRVHPGKPQFAISCYLES